MTLRTESLEWHTHICDTIISAEVSGITEIELEPPRQRMRKVELTPTKTLKGRNPGKVAVLQYHRENKTSSIFTNEELKPGHEVLLFGPRRIVFDPYKRAPFWTSLTRPKRVLSTHAVYNNLSRRLTTKEEILGTVLERIARDKPSRLKKRGLITRFEPARNVEFYWDFVRTADPEFKPGLIRDLQAGHRYDVETAIYNLISYPGKETRSLIRPFLQHPQTDTWRGQNVYPLRELAWLALHLLGEEVVRPAGFVAGHWYWQLWSMGDFENEKNFPQGDWKRVDYLHGDLRDELVIYRIPKARSLASSRQC